MASVDEGAVGRRRFLQGSAALAGVAAPRRDAVACAPTRRGRPSATRVRGRVRPHVVVIRWRTALPTTSWGGCPEPTVVRPDPRSDGDGVAHDTHRLTGVRGVEDPGHSVTAGRIQYNDGQPDGFPRRSRHVLIGY